VRRAPRARHFVLIGYTPSAFRARTVAKLATTVVVTMARAPKVALRRLGAREVAHAMVAPSRLIRLWQPPARMKPDGCRHTITFAVVTARPCSAGVPPRRPWRRHMRTPVSLRIRTHHKEIPLARIWPQATRQLREPPRHGTTRYSIILRVTPSRRTLGITQP